MDRHNAKYVKINLKRNQGIILRTGYIIEESKNSLKSDLIMNQRKAKYVEAVKGFAMMYP